MNRTVFAVRNVYDKLTKAVGSWETVKFYWRTYFLSQLDDVNPDIYIVSYPKCGRTWLRVMLLKYLEKLSLTLQEFNDRALVGIQDGLVIRFEHDQGNWVPAPPRVDQLRFDSAKYAGKKVVFLVRDPRDVLVSSWYHLKYRERIYRGNLSEFIREDLVGIQKVVEFMNMWVEHRNVPDGFHLMTYESLHHAPVHHFEEMLKFMGADVESEAVPLAVQASSFERMKHMEKTGSLEEAWMRPGANNSNESLKVRKGEVGGFENELPNRDIEYLNGFIDENLSPELSFYHSVNG